MEREKKSKGGEKEEGRGQLPALGGRKGAERDLRTMASEVAKPLATLSAYRTTCGRT